MNAPIAINHCFNQRRDSLRTVASASFLLLLAWSVMPARSEQATTGFQLVAATVDSGGGQSSGGPFVLKGTLGQPWSGASRGGDYHLESGFGPMTVLVQEPDAPALSIVRLNRQMSVVWPAESRGFRLQTTTTSGASGVWSDVKETPALLGAQWQVPISTSAQLRFYRLRRD